MWRAAPASNGSSGVPAGAGRGEDAAPTHVRKEAGRGADAAPTRVRKEAGRGEDAAPTHVGTRRPRAWLLIGLGRTSCVRCDLATL